MLNKIYLVSTGENRNEPLEGLRALAVGLVFMAHFCVVFAREYFSISLEGVCPQQLDGLGLQLLCWGSRSHYGVELFFLLSGFLVFRLLIARQGRFRYFHYLGQRISRIYPALLASLMAFAAMRVWWEGGDAFSMKRFLQNVFLLNGVLELGIRPYNGVTWSLLFEMLFYLLCPLWLLFAAQGVLRSPWRFGAMAVAIAAPMLWLPGFYFRGIVFLVGGWLAVHTDEQLQRFAQRVPDAIAVLLYLTCTTAYGFLPAEYHWRWFVPPFSIAAALLMVNSCYGTGGLNRLFRLLWVRYLGNLSYSFFLIHCAGILAALFLLKPRLPTAIPLPGRFAILLVTALVLSWCLATILYLTTERGYFAARHAGTNWRRHCHQWGVVPAVAVATVLFALAMSWYAPRAGGELRVAQSASEPRFR